jgi:hypothetical protein
MIINKKLLAIAALFVAASIPFYATGIEKVTYGPGAVPLGGMIAVVPNLDTASAWQPPASGVIKDGFMRADGATVPSGQGSPLQGRVLPNMTPSVGNDRYLKASRATSWTTGSYAVSGSNTKTIAVANLPSHNHSMAHTHAIDHDHAAFDTASGGAHAHSIYWSTTQLRIYNTTAQHAGGSGLTVSDSGLHAMSATSTGSAHTHTIDVPNFTGNSGASSAANTGDVGSGTALNIEPAYLEVVYVIRVK